MADNKLRKLIVAYLQEAKMMQLATVGADGRPWVCNVWFAVDKDLNVYWFSATTRRHSKEILQNSHVAAAICLPRGPEDASRGGIQLEGTAKVLTKPTEVAVAMKYYVGRKIFTASQVADFMKHVTKPHRFYKITPSSIVLFDTVHYPDESRQELTLG